MQLSSQEYDLLKHKIVENISMLKLRIYIGAFLLFVAGVVGTRRSSVSGIEMFGLAKFSLIFILILIFWSVVWAWVLKLYELLKDKKEQTKERHTSLVESIFNGTNSIEIRVNNKKHQLEIDCNLFFNFELKKDDQIEYDIFKNSNLLIRINKINYKKIDFLNISTYEI